MTAQEPEGRVLRLRPPLKFFPLRSDRGLLVGDGEYYVQDRAQTVAVLSLIDGRRTETDIVRDAAGQVLDFHVLELLNILEQKGWVVERGRERDELETVFGLRPGIGAAQISRRFSENPAILVNLFSDRARGEAQAASLKAAFERLGIPVIFSLPDGCRSAGIHILLADSLAALERDEYRRWSRQRETPLCFVQPSGRNPVFTPLICAEDDPCPACISFWLSINRPVETYLRQRDLIETSDSSILFEPAARMIYELVAVNVARSLLPDASDREEFRLTAVEVPSMTVSHHAVRRRPQCPVCGNPAWMNDQGYRPVVLREAIKTYTNDGGYRCLSPEDAFEKYAPLISPMTGAVTQVGPMPGRYAHTRPVFVSGYRVVPSGEEIDRYAFQRVCAGKGRRPEQARMSALAEAIERFSGVYQGDEARRRAPQEELGDAAFPPSALLSYSERQYADRERCNREASSPTRRIPVPYCSRTPIDWTPAWSLTCNARRYVPFSYCFSETPAGGGNEFCPQNGNGAAAGTCLEEAILQGVLETVERDAVAVWWYNRITRPGVDLCALQSPYFDRLQAEYRRRGCLLWVLDLTHDLGIPVFAALCCTSAKDRFSIGFGCHLNPRLAIQRALTELNQLFDPDGELRTPWDMNPAHPTHFLFPEGFCAATCDLSPPASEDIRDDISYCIDRLSNAGMELIVVDKTRPDLGLSAVHVIVPGLRHFRPQLGPGRLYSVPKKMGWLAAENTEDEMNPVPLWL